MRPFLRIFVVLLAFSLQRVSATPRYTVNGVEVGMNYEVIVDSLGEPRVDVSYPADEPRFSKRHCAWREVEVDFSHTNLAEYIRGTRFELDGKVVIRTGDPGTIVAETLGEPLPYFPSEYVAYPGGLTFQLREGRVFRVILSSGSSPSNDYH